MNAYTLQRLHPSDNSTIELIAKWYFQEWNLGIETTKDKLSKHPAEGFPFQLLLTEDGVPIATGGLYDTVSVQMIEPKFKEVGPWIALLYTVPDKRGKGIGALLCKTLEEEAHRQGFKKIYLFTHTAESLYTRLQWNPIERFSYKERRIVVMEKELLK